MYPAASQKSLLLVDYEGACTTSAARSHRPRAVPGPHITIGTHLKVFEAWGFMPCTFGFDWVKTNADDSLYTGAGYYTLSNSEVCLLALKGSPLRLATDVHQVVMAPAGEHSEKPEEVRRGIARLFPGPYLELYGRKPEPAWTV
jgi:N6-adenosine-specific RNA methylase IME4